MTSVVLCLVLRKRKSSCQKIRPNEDILHIINRKNNNPIYLPNGWQKVAAPMPARALKTMRVGKAMGALLLALADNCLVVTVMLDPWDDDDTVAVMVAKGCGALGKEEEEESCAWEEEEDMLMIEQQASAEISKINYELLRKRIRFVDVMGCCRLIGRRINRTVSWKAKERMDQSKHFKDTKINILWIFIRGGRISHQCFAGYFDGRFWSDGLLLTSLIKHPEVVGNL